MKRIDIVAVLIQLAGRIQAKRVAKLKAREEALKATIAFATKALTETQRKRTDAQIRSLGIPAK